MPEILPAKSIKNTVKDSTQKTIIIAEAGVNHNGSLPMALDLVKAAADAGADYVKFQTFKASSLVTQDAKQASYQKENTGKEESQYEMLRRLELTPDDHELIIEECRKNNIGFLSTAFDAASIDLLESFKPELWKIPSGELTNFPYLRRIAAMGKPVLLSTGMATLDEVKAALDVLLRFGLSRDQITLLHCTTEYPAPFDEINLRALDTLASLGCKVGYSDHTRGIEAAVAATALGATVIEKHFTLSRNLPGPDHKASLEPAELKALVSAVRNINIAMGDGVKTPSPSELRNAPIARKSIVAARKISAGDTFTDENLTTKRPGTGVSPMRWEEFVGRTAKRDYNPNDLIIDE